MSSENFAPGSAANIGANSSTSPTSSALIGGQYNTVLPTVTNGQLAALQTDANGRMLVNIGSSVAITATQGNPNAGGALAWPVIDSSDGPVAPGAAASYSSLIGGQFNTSLPTLATGQQAALQLDSSGRVLVGSIASALPAGTNTVGNVKITDGTNFMPTGDAAARAVFEKITDGTNTAAVKAASAAPAATDPALVVSMSPNSADPGIGPVSPGTVASKSYLIGGQYNTSLPTLTNTQQAAIQLDSSGRILVGSIASALPAGTNLVGYIKLTDGTNFMPTGDAVARAIFQKITDGTNTSAVKAASTAPAATDPALVVSMSPNSADPGIGPVAAGTAAAKSYLIGGVYNTSLPTLTTGQQAAIQLDSSGRQIVVVQSATAPVNANANQSTTGEAGISAATSEAAPSNSVGFYLQADDGNSDSIRWRMKGTATSTSGHQLQAGRDSGFIPLGAGNTLSLCPQSGTQKYSLSWVLSA